MLPIKNLVSENKQRLIQSLTDKANKHISENYVVAKEWSKSLSHVDEMDVYDMECEVVYKNNPRLSARFVISIVPVDVV